MNNPPIIWVDSPPNLTCSGYGFQAVQILPDYADLDMEEQVTDTVANLLHYAAANGAKLDEIHTLLERRWDHFRIEALGNE